MCFCVGGGKGPLQRTGNVRAQPVQRQQAGTNQSSSQQQWSVQQAGGRHGVGKQVRVREGSGEKI